MMMDQLILRPKGVFRTAKRVWAQVKDPAAAIVATAARLGWDFINAHTVITDLGATINLRVDRPKDVPDLVYEAVKRWRWKRVEKKHPYLATSGRGRGANMAPIWKLLRSKGQSENWHAGHRGALRSAFAGRQWTQSRCKAAGFATTIAACYASTTLSKHSFR